MPPSPSIGNKPPSIDPSDENTPLLSYVEPAPLEEPSNGLDEPDGTASVNDRNQDGGGNRPLPITQVLLLCYSSCIGPVAFFSIIPYITFMIERVGSVPKEDVGFYSGLIESLFSATQMCVMILWGKVCGVSSFGSGKYHC
jgi:hypothetical protein